MFDEFTSHLAPPNLKGRHSRRSYSAGLAGASVWSKAAVSSSASVVRYGQLAEADVAAVASAAEAIDEVT